MLSHTKAGAAALVASIALGAPAAAQAATHSDRFADAPSRVAGKARAAERALDRAAERADDGEADGAASALTAVRRNLRSATTSAARRVTASSETGAASADAVATVSDDVVEGVVGLLDGAGDTVTTGGVTTLAAALDDRDAIVAKIAALDDTDREDYADVLDGIVASASDEADAIGESLSDDELTAAAKAALTDALTQLNATAKAADAATVDASSDDEDEDASYLDEGDDAASYPAQSQAGRERGRRGGDCPKGARPSTSTGYEDQTSTPGQYGV